MSTDNFISIQNCFPIKGYNRSVILDAQRHQLYYVPHEIQNILEYNYGNSISEVLTNCDVDDSLVTEYIDFLLDKELIYIIPLSLKDSFPMVKKEFKSSSLCELIIIEFSDFLPEQSLFDFFNTHFIEIRIDLINIPSLLNCIDNLSTSTIHSIELYVTNSTRKEVEHFQSDLQKLALIPRIVNIYIESSINLEIQKMTTIEKIEYDSSNVSVETNMIVNIKFFMESNFFNPYYNNKLFIDSKGSVFNTPKKRISFGSIQKIQDKKEDIKLLWKHNLNIPNEEVEECYFCEYRLCCMNSLERKINSSRKLFNSEECDYNPFISKWKDEEGYQTLSACGVISNEKGFSIDHERIAAINEALWGEE